MAIFNFEFQQNGHSGVALQGGQVWKSGILKLPREAKRIVGHEVWFDGTCSVRESVAVWFRYHYGPEIYRWRPMVWCICPSFGCMLRKLYDSDNKIECNEYASVSVEVYSPESINGYFHVLYED